VHVFLKTDRISCFAANLEISNAFFVEFMGIILALKCVMDRNWRQLWIEGGLKLALPWQSRHQVWFLGN
jgi:hypothetical protein